MPLPSKPFLSAARAGVTRGRIEIRQQLTNREDLANLLIPAVIFLVVMFFMRGSSLPGTNFSLGSATVPGVLGAGIMFSGLVGMASALAIDREDGTLLRAKAIPNGMSGYLLGKILSVSGATVLGMLVTLIPSLFLFDGLASDRLLSWLGLLWVLAVGLLATMPLGAVLGSLTSNARNIGLIMLPILGLGAISGISTRSPHCRSGCRGSPRCSRCTGWGWACAPRCCRTARCWSRSGSRGGIWRPWASWRRGP